MLYREIIIIRCLEIQRICRNTGKLSFSVERSNLFFLLYKYLFEAFSLKDIVFEDFIHIYKSLLQIISVVL